MVFATKTVGEAMPVYDAVVIGSGYGGGVAASRLARMGLRLAVLEQGRHWRPGDFPTTGKARRKTLRLTGRAPKLGDPAGLYYLSVGKGLTVFGASGLGGGSLINAGVVLRPDLGRLRKAGWPDAVVGDGLLLKGLARAEAMLGVAPVPGPERFAKFAGMRRAAEASGRSVQLPPMTISHSPGPNAAGVMQYACRHCGDCWSGCNVGAKNTVGITYIADAVDHGADGASAKAGPSRSPRPERVGDRGAGSVEGGRKPAHRGADRRPGGRHDWGPTSCSCGRSSVVSRSRRRLGENSRPTATTSYSRAISTSRSMPLPRAFHPRRHGGPRRSGPTAWR